MNVSDEYKEDYYEKELTWKPERYLRFSQILLNKYKPKTILDVGCGDGILFRDHPRKVWGIEGSLTGIKNNYLPSEKLYWLDLRTNISLGMTFDLVVSLEVAEHIEERYVDNYIDNLVRHGDLLVVSISQKKHEHHHTIRSSAWWVEQFDKGGASYCKEETDELKGLCKGLSMEPVRNLYVFRVRKE